MTEELSQLTAAMQDKKLDKRNDTALSAINLDFGEAWIQWQDMELNKSLANEKKHT